jgi:hypothetical protein
MCQLPDVSHAGRAMHIIIRTTLHHNGARLEHLHHFRHDWLEKGMECLVICAVLTAETGSKQPQTAT